MTCREGDTVSINVEINTVGRTYPHAYREIVKRALSLDDVASYRFPVVERRGGYVHVVLDPITDSESWLNVGELRWQPDIQVSTQAHRCPRPRGNERDRF